MVGHGFFKSREVTDMCTQHLGVDGEMTMQRRAAGDDVTLRVAASSHFNPD